MSRRRYAESTEVPQDRSRAEIESILTRYGATTFGYMRDEKRAVVEFMAHARRIRFVIPMPDPHAREFTHTPARGNRRDDKARLEAYDQEIRRRWRALALAVKAKLEAVASSITTFEEEFMAHIVLPDGQTAAAHVLPAVARAYASGQVPPMLSLPPAPEVDFVDAESEAAA